MILLLPCKISYWMNAYLFINSKGRINNVLSIGNTTLMSKKYIKTFNLQSQITVIAQYWTNT